MWPKVFVNSLVFCSFFIIWFWFFYLLFSCWKLGFYFIVDNYLISFEERLTPLLSKCSTKFLRQTDKVALLELRNLVFNSYTIGFRWVNMFFILTHLLTNGCSNVLDISNNCCCDVFFLPKVFHFLEYRKHSYFKFPSLFCKFILLNIFQKKILLISSS